jgi:hypothetical protein
MVMHATRYRRPSDLDGALQLFTAILQSHWPTWNRRAPPTLEPGNSIARFSVCQNAARHLREL